MIDESNPIGMLLRRFDQPLELVLEVRLLPERGRAAGFAGNTGFRGVRNFAESEDIARLFADVRHPSRSPEPVAVLDSEAIVLPLLLAHMVAPEAAVERDCCMESTCGGGSSLSKGRSSPCPGCRTCGPRWR